MADNEVHCEENHGELLNMGLSFDHKKKKKKIPVA
jgi:hypothetical protein